MQQPVQMHIFPKDQVIFNIWIEKIGRNDLKDRPFENVRKSYRVCHSHFGAEAAYTGSRYKSLIRKDAIPSLLLSPIQAPIDTEGSTSQDLVTRKVEVQVATSTLPSNKPEEQDVTTALVGSSVDDYAALFFEQTSSASPIIGTTTKEYPATPPNTQLLEKLSTPAKISNLKKRISLLSYTKTRRALELSPKASYTKFPQTFVELLEDYSTSKNL